MGEEKQELEEPKEHWVEWDFYNHWQENDYTKPLLGFVVGVEQEHCLSQHDALLVCFWFFGFSFLLQVKIPFTKPVIK